ncbi:MAG TPA: YCF48-related protein [Ignavibacteria bacterium]|nr:hypothetical protein [Bacteroidota bacterium]HRI86418.1 YCF48-related protein [Ignavibacteria bacterium]HRJ98036.1 YCF48-related protein [Ignavibacteria bacterium]
MKKLILFIISIIPSTIFSQWIIQSSGTTENLRTVCFVNSQTGFAAGENGKMLRTSSGGMNWSNVTTGISQNVNSIYFFNADSGVVCADDGVIIFTENAGVSWITAASGVTDNLRAVSFVNSRGVCSGSGGTLLYSSNSGRNWTVAENGFLVTYYGADMFSETIAYSSGVNTIFQPFIAKTTNGGVNWSFSNFYLNGNEGNLSGIKFITASTGFASSRVFDGQGGISKTTDGGETWTTQLFPLQLHSIDFSGSNTGFSAGENGLILKTTDAGLTWTNQNGGSSSLRCVFLTDSITGYAAGDNGTILKTTNGGLSAVGSPEENVPYTFTLYQNYPNPFNPVTKIEFYLTESEYISLEVYNSAGKKIAELINCKVNSGYHSVTFDGNGLSGGIYFYRLATERFTENRKMVLIR